MHSAAILHTIVVIATLSITQSFVDPARKRTFSTKTKTFAFKQWPKPMIESHGDYRDEVFLEKIIGGELYSKQSTLPKLPLPKLESSAKKFVNTAIPLAESPEEQESLLEAVEKFPSQASVLQTRLEEWREKEMKDSSWLQMWWNTLGYLQFRDPNVIYVTYHLPANDDDTLPVDRVTPTKTLGIMRGAAALMAAAQFRKKVCSGDLPFETMGKKNTPLCSGGFKYMFNTCRVPHKDQDSVRMYDPSLFTHCIVASKGHFFAMDFVDKEGDPLPLNVIEDRLEQCVQKAAKLEEQQQGDDDDSSGCLYLGWLTSSNRDSWAVAREKLLELGGVPMGLALEKLESAACMICLDEEEPTSFEQCAEEYWHGGLTSGNNRWFDKTIQIICTKNGKVAVQAEHALMDGGQTSKLCEEIESLSYEDAMKTDAAYDNEDTKDKIENIFEPVYPLASDPDVKELISEAKSDFEKLIGDHEMTALDFKEYGTKYLAEQGCAADGYVQQAIQLATYRLFGKQVATYQSTQARGFLQGRTETTRTVSPSSSNFVKKMGPRMVLDDDEDTIEEKVGLLKEAMSRHIRYVGNAVKGNAVDRHFFGLSMMIQDGDDTPDLFSHPLFIRSKHWRVSSSCLPHAPGFGEVVPDGVGVGYGVHDDRLFFWIAARKEHGWVPRLKQLLNETLLEMQYLIDTEAREHLKDLDLHQVLVADESFVSVKNETFTEES